MHLHRRLFGRCYSIAVERSRIVLLRPIPLIVLKQLLRREQKLFDPLFAAGRRKSTAWSYCLRWATAYL
ncbi:hypothetical protein BURKHO8Y_20011 [Burkholderia sp. 8Y]|nr:hypothetical protein BURKHO8Y_20011 [Burkholderia sp. 8Y]